MPNVKHHLDFLWHLNFDPFGGAKARLFRRGKEATLRVDPEQA
jgi:hypothetical protein